MLTVITHLSRNVRLKWVARKNPQSVRLKWVFELSEFLDFLETDFPTDFFSTQIGYFHDSKTHNSVWAACFNWPPFESQRTDENEPVS